MKKFWISWLVVFVVYFAGGFVIHGLLLNEAYAHLPNLFRPEAEQMQYLYLMVIVEILLTGAFVWIYQRGVEDKSWLAQGIRYGIAVALLLPVPMFTVYFVVQPTPGTLAVQQILYESALMIVLGIVVAALNRPESAQSG